LLVLAGVATSLDAQERWRVTLEGGLAWAGRAGFAVPGDTGTRVDPGGCSPGARAGAEGHADLEPHERWSFAAGSPH